MADITKLAALGTLSVVGSGALNPRKMEEFREMALSLMAEHGLQEWGFQWDNAKRRAGQCRYGKCDNPGILSFSAPLMSLWTPEQQRDTVLHEIAHALTRGHGHDATWQSECVRIGADPARTWGHNGEEELESRYTGTCPNGHQTPRERIPSGERSCNRCASRFDRRYLIQWTRNY